MDIQSFKVFVAVAREGSQTRAAERLHLTQPAIGLQIKSLQQELGLELFTRTPQGMTLTPNGTMLLLLAEKVLDAQQEFKDAAARMTSEVRGSLAIGTILDPEFIRLGAFLSALLEMGHRIDIKLSHGMSGDVVTQILRGELDAGFSLDFPKQAAAHNKPSASRHPAHHATALEIKALTSYTYRVVAPVGWEPQVLGKDWKALASLPWVGTPAASVHHRLLARVFGPGSLTGMEPKWIALVDQESSMLDVVKSGAGLSLVRDHIAIREAQAVGLVIADQVSLDCEMSFVCLQSRVNDPVIAAASAAIDKVWRLR